MKKKYIYILDKKYELLETPYSDINRANMGWQDAFQLQIWINPAMAEEQKQSTLIHECIHAIEMQLGLNLTESQVQGLETGLFMMGFCPNIVLEGGK